MFLGWVRCYCNYLIEARNYVIECPRCGRKFIYKQRSHKYVLMYDPNLR